MSYLITSGKVKFLPNLKTELITFTKNCYDVLLESFIKVKINETYFWEQETQRCNIFIIFVGNEMFETLT